MCRMIPSKLGQGVARGINLSYFLPRLPVVSWNTTIQSAINDLLERVKMIP